MLESIYAPATLTPVLLLWLLLLTLAGQTPRPKSKTLKKGRCLDDMPGEASPQPSALLINRIGGNRVRGRRPYGALPRPAPTSRTPVSRLFPPLQ